MNNNAIYPSPLENLAAMVICVVIGVAITKFHDWSLKKASVKEDSASTTL